MLFGVIDILFSCTPRLFTSETISILMVLSCNYKKINPSKANGQIKYRPDS